MKTRPQAEHVMLSSCKPSFIDRQRGHSVGELPPFSANQADSSGSTLNAAAQLLQLEGMKPLSVWKNRQPIPRKEKLCYA